MKTMLLREKDLRKGSLILVNRQHPLCLCPAENELEPVCIGGEQVQMQRAPAVFLRELALVSGENLMAVSGYRTGEEQKALYFSSLNQNGLTFTEQYVARPSCSEHETGLAVDLGKKDGTVDSIRPHLPYDGLFGAYRKKLLLYGFCERYQKEKEKINGIAAEPWHFRYVGAPHAQIMQELDFCLEEYLSFMKQYRYPANRFVYQNGGLKTYVSFVPLQNGGWAELAVRESIPYSISGNNVDGFILTEWGY